MPEELSKKKESKTLLEWKAPVRVFKKRERKYFANWGLGILALGLVLIFFKQFLLLGAILALFFLSYALGTVPPEKINHKITTSGITSGGKSYLWKELRDFYFTEKYGVPILNVSTKMTFPARLILLLQGVEKKEVEDVLATYLPFREVPPSSLLDKAADFAATKLKLD